MGVMMVGVSGCPMKPSYDDIEDEILMDGRTLHIACAMPCNVGFSCLGLQHEYVIAICMQRDRNTDNVAC